MNRKIVLIASMLIVLLAALLPAGISPYDVKKKPTKDWFSGNNRDIGWNWMQRADDIISVSMGIGNGRIFYVDSGVGTEGSGISWETAKDTFAEAVALCQDARGDTIMVNVGHTETITSATTVSIDYLTVICLGNSGPFSGPTSGSPIFQFDGADACIKITGAAITWLGGEFISDGSVMINHLIDLSTGNNFRISGASFGTSEASVGTFINVDTADSVDSFATIENCFFNTLSNMPANSAINIGKDEVGWTIKNNIMYGDFNEAAINVPVGGNAQVDLSILSNIITNIQAGQHAIQINGTGNKGIIAGNYLSTNSASTDVDAGGLAMVGNYFGLYATDSDTDYGPMDGATVTTFTGYGLDHLGSLADGTGQYPVSVVQDSWMAFLMSKSADPVATSFDNRTDSLEMLSDKLGGFSGDGGANQDDSVKASLDLAHTDLDTTITAVGTTIPAQIEDVNTNILALVADVNTNVLAEIVDSNTNIITLVTDANTNVTAQIADVNTNILASIGTYFSTTSVVESNDIPDNNQVGGAITGAASGTLLLTDIIVNTDATGWATPTNIEFSTDNAFGNTGADLPVFVEVIASFGTNLTVSKKDATSHTLPVIIESGKKVFIHGDDAAGTGAGYGKVTLVFQRLTAGATITAADLDTD
jgi:hypothetical protein